VSAAWSGLRLDVIQAWREAFAPLQGLGVIGRAFGAGLANFTPQSRDFATDADARWMTSPTAVVPGMVLQARKPVSPLRVDFPPHGCRRRRVLAMEPGRGSRAAAGSAPLPAITASGVALRPTTRLRRAHSGLADERVSIVIS